MRLWCRLDSTPGRAVDADGAAAGHPVIDQGAGRPRWRVLDADTEAETDPRIQQESDICADMGYLIARLVEVGEGVSGLP